MTKHTTFKKMALAFSAIALVIAFSSCSDKNAKRFKDAAMNLDNTSFTLTYEYDYWPDGGIRNIGGHLASLISLNDLEKMLPCPLYVSGPHRNGEWDLYSDDFGHYNPEAIKFLDDLAKKVVSDKKFVAESKPLVDKYLYRQMLCMMVIHDFFYDDEVTGTDYREYLFSDALENYGYSDEASYYLSNIYIEEVDQDDSYIYWGYNYEFFNWWARRWKDGTIDLFYDGISTIFKAYHPEYEYDFDKYYYMEEYGDWDWYMETEYSCDLEDDEPIKDNERIKESEAVGILRNAATNLDKTEMVLVNEFDYWPECGIRVTGGHLFSLISLRSLNKMLPCDLYVSGPHYYNRWNLEDPFDFGHYNPEAIRYIGKLAKQVVSDKKFVENTKPLIDEYLKRQMYILISLYDALNDKNVCSDKQGILDMIMGQEGRAYYGTDTFDFLDSLPIEDGSYVYSNTGEMFLYWWARRDADGTMDLFYDALKTIYTAYYPEG